MNDQSSFSRLMLPLLGLLIAGNAFGHGENAPPSLRLAKIPPVPGLLDRNDALGVPTPIVVNKEKAIALGKALFWDMQVGSDGMACGSCHFTAGADHRIKNQIYPSNGNVFDPTASGGQGGPNYTLTRSDFPTTQFNDPADKTSGIKFHSDDVIGSQGVFKAQFTRVNSGRGRVHETCDRSQVDPVFSVGGVNTRRLEPRNTPTMINAVFNFRNFWDGRANNIFNGRTAFGDRDPNAFIWVAQADGSVAQARLRLENSALASQAMDPPARSTTEMPCAGRPFEELGRKLLNSRPLAMQRVHPQDSVLGRYRARTGKGLRLTYSRLIRQAFNPTYWRGRGNFGTGADGRPYTMMEANFSLFFGLAIQLYESTLVSDQSPYDLSRFQNTTVAEYLGIADPRMVTPVFIPIDLPPAALRGLALLSDSHCTLCHGGSLFSSAVHPDLRLLTTPGADPGRRGQFLTVSDINRVSTLNPSPANGMLADTGFFNTGVIAPGEEDLGVGGTDPFGNPLSFAAQYVESLRGNTAAVLDTYTVHTCEFQNSFFDLGFANIEQDFANPPGCIGAKPTLAAAQAEYAQPDHGKLKAVPVAFKVPSLRNVELTGPYFHNGSAATLREVLEFYNRNGNFDMPHKSSLLSLPLGLSDQDMSDMVAFFESLTDPRVKWEKAPFDHPEIYVPAGHVGDENFVSARPNNTARDEWMRIPEVGRNGRTAAMGPLKTFEQVLCEANPADPKCPVQAP